MTKPISHAKAVLRLQRAVYREEKARVALAKAVADAKEAWNVATEAYRREHPEEVELS